MNKVNTLQSLNKVLFAIFIAGAILPAKAIEAEDTSRIKAIAQRGALVMPFNLEATQHIFSKNIKGGLQQVLVKNKNDQHQVELIRQHLLEISRQFKQGDYSNPTKIHGTNMPGLAVLKQASPNDIKIRYSQLSDGAQILYESSQPKMIKAIHRWFDAQLSDHAQHAMPHHPHHQSHGK